MSVKARKFSVGDKVIINHKEKGLKDRPGTITSIDHSDGSYGVNVDGSGTRWLYAQSMRLASSKATPVAPAPASFKIGDRVTIKNYESRINGKSGTLRVIDGVDYGIEFDEYQPHLHDLRGKVKKGFGYWVYQSNLVHCTTPAPIINPCKFGVGDKVMIRYWDDMKEEFGVTSDVINPSGEVAYFNSLMKTNCGAIATILSVDATRKTATLKFDDPKIKDSWTWCFFMFRLAEKAKIVPKKQLTVAEVEKLLGYGVEVVKEVK